MSYEPPETPLAGLLRRHGLNQTEVAESAGISQPYLSQISSGARVPSVSVARQLILALRQRTGEDITFEQLFGAPALPAAVGQ